MWKKQRRTDILSKVQNGIQVTQIRKQADL